MKTVLLLFPIYFTLGMAELPNILNQPLTDYLACMSKYSKATYVENMKDTLTSFERTVTEKSKAKAVDVFKKEILTENKVLENKDDGMMPVSFKTVVTSSSTAMNQDVSGTSVGLSAGGGANVGKFGFSVSGSFEKGDLQNTSQISQNVTQQSWERNFKVPPHMKVTRRMALYERRITTPGVFRQYFKGFIPIQFEDVKASKYRNLWKECGVSKPKPVIGTAEKIFAVKLDNFAREPKTKALKNGWKVEKDGTVTLDLRKTEAKETREFVLTETHVVLDPKVKLTEYCDDIDPEKETDPVSNTKMEKGDQVTKVEGNVNVNKVNFDYNFGSGDDDDDKKKPKNKNKKKNKNRRRKSGK